MLTPWDSLAPWFCALVAVEFLQRLGLLQTLPGPRLAYKHCLTSVLALASPF